MPPLNLAYLIVLLITLPLAWVKGGAPERVGAAALLGAWMLALLFQDVTLGKTYVGEAGVDLALTGVFVWLVATRRRWWLLAALALMVLTLAVHLATVFLPELSPRGDRVARMALGLVLTLTLLAGVLERWLSGEPPVRGFGFGRIVT